MKREYPERRIFFEDFFDIIPMHIAIADGLIRYHKDGYVDDDGHVFDISGRLLYTEKED